MKVKFVFAQVGQVNVIRVVAADAATFVSAARWIDAKQGRSVFVSGDVSQDVIDGIHSEADSIEDGCAGHGAIGELRHFAAVLSADPREEGVPD